MKMKREHYVMLRAAIHDMLTKASSDPQRGDGRNVADRRTEYAAIGLSEERFIWDAYWIAITNLGAPGSPKRGTFQDAMNAYNDAHITTALKQVFAEPMIGDTRFSFEPCTAQKGA